MIKLEKGSFSNNTLPKGCELCRLGAKMVLFVTGICAHHCFYCPLSTEKKSRDVIYADEMPVSNIENILQEARCIDALGTGITGGDPVARLDRTVEYIKILKKEFGEEHHIHLYTVSGNKKAFEKLEEAGLDEIRIHVPFSYWNNLKASRYFEILNASIDAGLYTGIEVPAIPAKEKELLNLINSAKKLNVKFINLNELEFSETNWRRLKYYQYQAKSYISSAVKGSEATAMKVVERSSNITVHYCTASFKDAVQMKNRLLRRANNIAKKYELITKDGTLLKGLIKSSNPDKLIELLIETYQVPKDLMAYDKDCETLYIAPWILSEIAKDLDHECYINEEYPTWDRLEVERFRIK